MGGTARRGMSVLRPRPAQSPPRCTKCNSPPINGQCTNHCIAVCISGLEVWLSGNALALINVVALRHTRLVVPGWVTVCGRVNHLGR